MSNERYPKVVEGDLMNDNFFDANPEIEFYPEMKLLIENETRTIASKIMWSFFILKDPRSFYFDKMTYEERKRFVITQYYEDIEFPLLKHIEEFYEDKLLINEDILHYTLLVKKFEKNVVENDKFTAQMASKEKEALIIFKQKAYSILNTVEMLRIQGKVQPGFLARRKVRDIEEDGEKKEKVKSTKRYEPDEDS